MPRSSRSCAACLFAACCLLLTACDDDCDHPLDPGGETVFEAQLVRTQAELEALRGIEYLARDLTIDAACDTCHVDDLSPLAELRGVGSLTIIGTALTDLHGLEQLATVQGGLQISENANLADIGALASVSQVSYLLLRANPLLDSVAALGGARGLVQIDVDQLDALVSLDVFADLDELYRLDVHGCTALQTLPRTALPHLGQLALVSLPALGTLDVGDGALPALQQVYLQSLPAVADAQALADLPSLEVLNLVDLPTLAALPPQGAAPEIRQVRLTDLPLISDLSALGATTTAHLNLERLAGIDDLAGLAALPRLSACGISDCPALTSLEGLADAPVLESLGVYGCPLLTEVGNVSGLAALNWLTFEGTGLEDLASLAPLAACGTLDLRSCPDLVSLDGLAAFTELERLRLQDLPALADLGQIDSLPWLAELMLIQCAALTDLQGLGALPALDRLLVTGNAQLLDVSGPSYPPAMTSVTLQVNPVLAALDGLAAVDSVTALTIRDNLALGDAAAFAFAEGLDFVGEARIGGNHP